MISVLCPEIRLLVRSNPPPEPGGADEAVRWYREEHLPRLCAVPGTLRARLYRADAGISGIVTAERQTRGLVGLPGVSSHIRDALARHSQLCRLA